MSEGVRLRHMPGLDGLRGIAVVGVLAFHAGFLKGGYLGVDLFFVLSGFLITSLLIAEERETGRIDLRRFWIRRARRLLPALFALLLAVAGYALLWAPKASLLQLRHDSLAALLYVANWRAVATEHDYWALFQAPSPLAHTWSLAIEEQFYLLWPLVVVLLARGGGLVRRLRWLSALGAALSATWLVVLFLSGNESALARAYYGTDTRLAAILIGAAAAAWLSTRGLMHGRPRILLEGAAWLAALALGAAWYALGGQDRLLYSGGLALCGLAAGLVIAVASLPEPRALGRLLSWAPLRWLGAISYGLYLWHWPIYLLLSEAFVGMQGAGLAALRIGVSLVVAIISYVALEQPLRRGALSGRTMWLAAPAVFFAVVAATYLSTAHAPTSEPALTLELAAPLPPTSSATLRVMLAGDSVAERLGAEIPHLGGDVGMTVEARGAAGCGLLGRGRLRLPSGKITLIGEGCAEGTARWRAPTSEPPFDVVLLLWGGAVIGDREIDGQWRHACEPAFDERFRVALTDAIDALSARGAVVALTTAAYPSMVGYADEHHRRVDCLNEIVRDAAAQNTSAALVELADLVCPSRDCKAAVDGALLRPDGLHYMGQGGRQVLRWLLGEVRALPLNALPSVE